jgi:hypothetical protein
MPLNPPDGQPLALSSGHRRSAHTQERQQVLLFHRFADDSLDTPGGGYKRSRRS